MSAVLESETRAPGLPQPLPNSADALAFAEACVRLLEDDDRISIKVVRALIATGFDAGMSQARHDAFMAQLRGLTL